MDNFRFINFPSTETPINETNLNKLNNSIVSPHEPTTKEHIWGKCGKNKFNKNAYCDDSTGAIAFIVHLENGKKYTISSNKPLTVIKFAPTGVAAGKFTGPESWNGNITKWTFTAGNNKELYNNSTLFLGVKVNTISNDIADFADYNIQIEEGENATEFEEYVEKNINVLNANNDYEKLTEYETNYYKINENSCRNAACAVEIGTYRTDPETVDLPSNLSENEKYGILIVECTSSRWMKTDVSSWIWQTFKNTNGAVYVRNAINAGFNAWKKIY